MRGEKIFFLMFNKIYRAEIYGLYDHFMSIVVEFNLFKRFNADL